MSIREKQTISFVASSDDTAEELLVCEINGIRLLKMAVIYGANASGKSNVLYALEMLWRLMFEPYPTKEHRIRCYQPFALNADKPTEFDIVFYAYGVKYHYYVKYNSRDILYEKLEYAPNGVLSKFYERNYDVNTDTSRITFGSTLSFSSKSKIRDALIANTLNNHTLISTYGKISIDAPEIKKLHDWIREYVHEINSRQKIGDIVEQMLQNTDEKSFFLKAVTKADFNISDIELVDDDEDLKKIIKEKKLPSSVADKLLKEVGRNVNIRHTSELGDFTLNTGVESSGTLKYISLLQKMYNITTGDHIYLLDEMENGLHYDLLIHYLTMFMLNSSSSQLIMTTHDQMLLDEEFIRRDIVWFTEKNRKTASTNIYSARDFSLHKNVSLYNAYKAGKLGAKPEIGSPFL